MNFLLQYMVKKYQQSLAAEKVRLLCQMAFEITSWFKITTNLLLFYSYRVKVLLFSIPQAETH